MILPVVIFLISLSHSSLILTVSFFFFNDTATTEIYTLSLHDALPISLREPRHRLLGPAHARVCTRGDHTSARSEEHTSELQSRSDLVCRLLLEKKKRHLGIARNIDVAAALGTVDTTLLGMFMIRTGSF